jgi:protein-arginine kinase
MLKLSDVIPQEILKILEDRGFKLVGPWAEYYQLGGNIFKVSHLPLKVEFSGSDASILEEINPYAKQVIHGKNKVALRISRRHWLVLKFKPKIDQP